MRMRSISGEVNESTGTVPSTRSAKKRRALAATAYHEAGHAVVAVEMHRPLRRVTVVPDGARKTLGCCEQAPWPRWFRRQPRRERDNRTRDFIEAQALIDFAGGIAEARFKGSRRRLGACRDRNNALTLLERLSGSRKECEAYAAWLYARTENLLAQGYVWRMVEAVAAELLRKGTLSGRQLRACCSQAFAAPRAPRPRPSI
jgi:hypothetical protein